MCPHTPIRGVWGQFRQLFGIFFFSSWIGSPFWGFPFNYFLNPIIFFVNQIWFLRSLQFHPLFRQFLVVCGHFSAYFFPVESPRNSGPTQFFYFLFDITVQFPVKICFVFGLILECLSGLIFLPQKWKFKPYDHCRIINGKLKLFRLDFFGWVVVLVSRPFNYQGLCHRWQKASEEHAKVKAQSEKVAAQLQSPMTIYWFQVDALVSPIPKTCYLIWKKALAFYINDISSFHDVISQIIINLKKQELICLLTRDRYKQSWRNL